MRQSAVTAAYSKSGWELILGCFSLTKINSIKFFIPYNYGDIVKVSTLAYGIMTRYNYSSRERNYYDEI